MSPHDAVDGSSTRHESAKDVGAVEAPTIRRSYHASGHPGTSAIVPLSGSKADIKQASLSKLD